MKNKNKTKPFQARQGDVLIVAVDSIPKSAVKQDEKLPIILALGEATGHHHLLERNTSNSADWWKGDNTQFVNLKEPLDLVHQEHGKIPVPDITIEVIKQREYSPEAIRNVQD